MSPRAPELALLFSRNQIPKLQESLRHRFRPHVCVPWRLVLEAPMQLGEVSVYIACWGCKGKTHRSNQGTDIIRLTASSLPNCADIRAVAMLSEVVTLVVKLAILITRHHGVAMVHSKLWAVNRGFHGCTCTSGHTSALIFKSPSETFVLIKTFVTMLQSNMSETWSLVPCVPLRPRLPKIPCICQCIASQFVVPDTACFGIIIITNGSFGYD
jgi:hypothetical protein